MAIDSYKLKNGQTRYRVAVYINGERIAQKRGFKTKKEAKDYEARIRVKGVRSNAKTYDAVEKLYIESLEADLEGSSVYTIENALHYNVPQEWRHRNIASITPTEIQRAVNTISARCKTGAHYAYMISKIFKYAEDIGALQTNPFKRVRMPKQEEPDPDGKWAIWTPEQFALFLETSKQIYEPMAYPLFRLYLYTGTRHGEPIAFKWSDFDYESRTFDLEHAIGVDRHGKRITKKPKHNSKRLLVVDQETADAVESLRKRSTSDRIFPIGYATVYAWFIKIEKKAGLPHSRLHNFRVEHCSILLQNGAYLKDVQKRLGHKDAKTTLNVYARANKDSGDVLNYIPKNHYTAHYAEK